MGIAEVLTVIFIVLKLLGIITWSWFFVLSPLIFITLPLLVIAIAIYLYITIAIYLYIKS